jgi:hypothetical protein
MEDEGRRKDKPLVWRSAVSQSRTHPKGCPRLPPLDAPGTSSGVGTSQVRPSVLIEAVPQEARLTEPDEALIRAIVELKSRNPQFGCPRIARIICQTFGLDIDKNIVSRVVVMDQFTRPLVGLGVHRGALTGVDVCCMFNAAIHGQGTPRHLSTDHDRLFEAHRWRVNLRILELDEIKTVPHVPLSQQNTS